MNLNSNDYKAMICARADHIRMALYPQQYGNAAPQAIGYNNAAEPNEVVPDFALLKVKLDEIQELADAYAASIGPA